MTLQDLFISFLSRFPQKLELDLENHFGAVGAQATLERLRQNRPIVVIELFYFIYHSLDRQFYGLIDKQVKDQILDRVVYEAILDMKSVHSGNVEIAIEILNNMDSRQEKYTMFESAIDNHTPLGPSVINHISGIVCSLVDNQRYRMELVVIFFKAYNALGTALLMTSVEESQKTSQWDMMSKLSDAEDMIMKSLLNTNFYEQ
jgi:hypothetical protein